MPWTAVVAARPPPASASRRGAEIVSAHRAKNRAPKRFTFVLEPSSPTPQVPVRRSQGGQMATRGSFHFTADRRRPVSVDEFELRDSTGSVGHLRVNSCSLCDRLICNP